MNIPYLVIGLLLVTDLLGIVLGLYGLGMAKGWWR